MTVCDIWTIAQRYRNCGEYQSMTSTPSALPAHKGQRALGVTLFGCFRPFSAPPRQTSHPSLLHLDCFK
ncbi:hypothetical protein J6590_026447 [Homalodisca vitripennis]|nr:hypothetical protein J6590_026447 [Homalodisca vitripennis]